MEKRIAAYTAEGIWGIGHTEEEAFDDALSYMGNLSDEEIDTVRESFSYGPMSQALAKRTEQNGFDCKHDTYTIVDGILCTIDES